MITLTTPDYLDFTEDQLLQEVRKALIATDTFLLHLKGEPEPQDAFAKPVGSLHVERLFRSLYRYAVGTVRMESGIGDLLADPTSFVILVSGLRNAGSSTFSSGAAYMQQTVVMAYARSKVDHLDGRLASPVTEPIRQLFEYGLDDGLSTVEMGLLAHIKVQSVRNKLSGQTEFKLVKDAANYHYLPMPEAIRWLQQQSGFMVPAHGEFTEGIAVPVARDGSFFHTALRGPKGYRIGKKGEEWVVDSFEEALAELKKMSDPFWRRPSRTSSVPGIVRGVRWEMRPRSEVYRATQSE